MFAQSPEVRIFDTQLGKEVSLETILEKAKDFSIIVFGEEHDDSFSHKMSLELYTKLTNQKPTSLSLEMLEKDQQTLTDDFLFFNLSESQFLSSAVFWKNFKEDYLPLVRVAKEKKLPVLCANPPRRYVNLVSKQGIVAYQTFSPQAETWMPEPSLLQTFLSREYEKNLLSLFGSSPHGKHGDLNNLVLAQSVWDQGMADSISREVFRSERRVFHLNGRFHSDREGGVVYRLRKMGHKVLVISSFEEGKEEVSDFAKIADFVILTKSR